MEYIFREKTYKVSKFKTFLTNQLKSQSLETANTFLLEFIQNNEFEFNDLISILDRFIDYAKRLGDENEKVLEFVHKKSVEYRSVENTLHLSNLFYKINPYYALNYIDENFDLIPNNSKEKVSVLLFKADILLENNELEKAFSVLRDCSDQCYDLYIFDALELKRTIYEKMAVICQLEKRSDAAISFYIYHCSFQAGVEFLHFPYLDTYRNFRLPYSIIENTNNEIIQIDMHLRNININIDVFNSFLQDLYRKVMPKAFKLENIDIDTFTVSNSNVQDLVHYTSYIPKLTVRDLVSSIELLTSDKIKDLL
ncbi:hypothetical protein ODZ84_05270 [Chryseobacterium fluminis]|uniref:hypothetical protein n=1 Tax=Chryseobacterium fluminis TaxID=2983606 RepID=UPI0022500E67|nr:hypothetical protein [Chryseobacterium sp. MMS21-Ot14]UZT98983.1 hypothetical protein ODZ84_05270 [Chryseobacterium sp. MMS21-Ot14]